jgi:hypothetical protein
MFFSHRYAIITGMILAAAVSRLIPHPPNLTPIGAIALFGGAYFPFKSVAFLVPLLCLLLSDLIIGLHGFMPVVYGCFVLIVCIGFRLRTRKSAVPIAIAVIVASISFFVITNLGVWALGSWYPKTIEGFIACYVAAIPFFRNTLLGDVTYTAMLFGGFALLEHRFPALRKPKTVSL